GRLRGSGSGGERGEIPAPAPLYQLDLGVLEGDAAHFDTEGEKRLDTHPHPHPAHADEGCRAEAWVVGDLETLEVDVGEREQGDGDGRELDGPAHGMARRLRDIALHGRRVEELRKKGERPHHEDEEDGNGNEDPPQPAHHGRPKTTTVRAACRRAGRSRVFAMLTPLLTE